MSIKFSKKTKKYNTLALRGNSDGKGRYDLIPTKALRRIAIHYENGGKKYGDRNWEKGVPLSRYLNSAIRHLYQVLEGQNDEDHEAAAVWNIMGFMETKDRINLGLLPKELDDLPK